MRARIKQLARRLIPARVLDRFRSLPTRSGSLNIDVMVAEEESRDAWIKATPDTVRVVSPGSLGPGRRVPVQYPGAVEPDLGVDGEGEVDGRRAGGKLFHIALRGEDENLPLE